MLASQKCRQIVELMHVSQTSKHVAIVFCGLLLASTLSACSDKSEPEAIKPQPTASSPAENAAQEGGDNIFPSGNIQPAEILSIGDTYDNGYHSVETGFETNNGVEVVAIKPLWPGNRDWNFYLEHWFVVTTKGRILAFEANNQVGDQYEVIVPALEDGEKLTIQFWQNGTYNALFTDQRK